MRGAHAERCAVVRTSSKSSTLTRASRPSLHSTAAAEGKRKNKIPKCDVGGRVRDKARCRCKTWRFIELLKCSEDRPQHNSAALAPMKAQTNFTGVIDKAHVGMR